MTLGPYYPLSLAALIFVMGCSSSSPSVFSPSDSGPPSDAASSDSGYGTFGNDSGSADSGVDAAPPTDSQCHMLTQAACVDCCSQAHADGFAAFTAAYMACGCTASACQTQCASSYCANPPSSPASTDPCGTCLYNALYTATGACYGPVNQACAPNTTCHPYIVCAVGDGTSANTGCQ